MFCSAAYALGTTDPSNTMNVSRFSVPVVLRFDRDLDDTPYLSHLYSFQLSSRCEGTTLLFVLSVTVLPLALSHVFARP